MRGNRAERARQIMRFVTGPAPEGGRTTENTVITRKSKKQLTIVELLSTFDPADYMQFRKFLHSPYFNNSPLYLSLLEHLQNEMQNGDAHTISFESIHAVLYPGRPFDSGKVRKLTARLSALIEHYFSLRSQERYPQNRTVYLTKELNKRYLGGMFDETIRHYEAGRTNMKLCDPTFMMNDLMIQYEVYRNNQSKMEFSSTAELIGRFDGSVELLYVDLKLIQINMDLWNKAVSSKDTDGQDAAAFLHTHKKRIAATRETFPGIYLQFLLAQLLLTRKRNNAATLITFMRHHVDAIHYGTVDFVFNIVLSYLMHERDNADLRPASILSYDDLIAFGIIRRHKLVPPLTYLFISMMEMQFPGNTTAESYVREFRATLNPEIKESIYCISLAILNMTKKEYGKALPLLGSAKRHNYHMYVTANLLEMQIFYELRQTPSLTAKIDAVKHYLSRRKEIPGEYKLSVQHFLHHIKMIATAREQRSDCREVQKGLAHDRSCMYREWLMQKAAELRVGRG